MVFYRDISRTRLQNGYSVFLRRKLKDPQAMLSGESTQRSATRLKDVRRSSRQEHGRWMTAEEALLTAEASDLAQSRRTTRAESLVYLADGAWPSSRTGLDPRRQTPAHAPPGAPRSRLIYDHTASHITMHVWPNIQAEGLTLQRSTNMCGYKHVTKDKSKPRPFQVKIWHNGKQARLVRSPRAPHCAVLFPTVAIQGAP